MMMGFWDAVALTGPYANNLHLAPGGQAPLAPPLAPGWPAGNVSHKPGAAYV